MLYLDRIDIFEGTDVNKTTASRECIICHYRYLLEINFMIQLKVYGGCHNVLIMSVILKDVAILNIFSVDYCCIITGISKNEALNFLQNTDFSKKVKIYCEI